MATFPIRFGIQTGQQGVAWEDLLELWRKADAWGYDSLWNFDHFYPIFADPEGECMEAWTTLAALGQATTRARIGCLVNGNTYRHPCLTAKMAASLDRITNGRLNLGLGAGWFELEHQSFGIDFKTVRGRLDALDEACQIIRGMFTQPKTTLRGKHYTVVDAMCRPGPVQRPYPPLLIGGTGRKVLLKLVAQHADMWNAIGSAVTMGEMVATLGRHCDTLGRDPDQIEKTVVLPLCYNAPREREALACAMAAPMLQTTPDLARESLFIGNAQECLDTVGRYRAVGITHFILMLLPPYHLDEVQAFAEDVAAVARR